MDEYSHELYFEAGGLTDRQIDKIWRHFQKKRDSGGGECGKVEKAGSQTYRIRFKEKDVQERVLQRKFHTISFPSGDVRLSVSRTESAPSLDQPQTVTTANTKGLQKNFRPDVFLLLYLKDSPRANKVLLKQLAAIGCTVEFDFDEEAAVVSGDIETSHGSAENWEIQVDRVFISLTENYSCHHVVEPKQVKALLQDLSFVTDDIKVYTESGYAVVVGENEAVKERIAILEKNLPSRKEWPIVEMQFKLVEEEFSREMRERWPEVKIRRGGAMITLEGPEEQVQSGARRLDELIKMVIEKRTQLPTVLLTFITSSGAVSRFQDRFQRALRTPVYMQVESDLLLSGLSSEDVDEALATLLRNLSLANVVLEDAAGEPRQLDKVKEIMMKAENEANREELRVNVSFIPQQGGTTKVRLVGYSENVNQLKEVLHDYQMNQVETQEVLNLAHPDLVDCFDEFLNMIGIKQNKVTIKILYSPRPHVLLSGPRSLVLEAQGNLSAALSCLTLDTLVLNGPGAQLYFQEMGKVSKEWVESSCQVFIREQKGVQSANVTSSSTDLVRPTPAPRTGSTAPVNKTSLEIKLGSLEDEQVNVLVVPMIRGNLKSTKMGKCLLKKSGITLQSNFDAMAASRTIEPGDVLQLDAPASLGCSKLFFVECLPWDGVRGKSVQALQNGLKSCLDLCVQQHFCSVAFPLIGSGIVLKYPPREAIQVLTETIQQFGLSASSGSLSIIHVIIKPDCPDSEKNYHDVYKQLSSIMNQDDKAIFRSLTSDLDDITMTVGGRVKLQLVFGDITNETTAVVVNTTDFENFDKDGVCKDILTMAGPEVEAELRAAMVASGEIYLSLPGSFPCEAIFHVCGEQNAGLVEQLVFRIIEYCETLEFKTVAIPAICAGSGGLDPYVVAGAILRGIRDAASFLSLSCVTEIRLVLIKINVFLAFKEEAMQMFSPVIANRVSVPQFPHGQQPGAGSSVSEDSSILHATPTDVKSAFLFLGLSRQGVDNAMAKFKGLYEAQCTTQSFKKEELTGLTPKAMKDLMKQVETQGLYMERDQGSLTVSGLKDGVNQVMQMINASLHGHLRMEVRVREEEDLYTRVAWCILGRNGNWERVPKGANHSLENKDLAEGIVDEQGVTWIVNLQRSEAKRPVTGQATQLKRLVNLPDFTLPLYWDAMADGENVKVFVLQPSSPEYQMVKTGFKQTVSKTVIKIERLQNVHLRRAYEVQKNHMADKNKQEGGTYEKLLYHGTTTGNSKSITQTGFNRRFAGQNATLYGHGTYFAVNAKYSAHPTYSKPAADGSQLMFVARVLTGIYTLGQKNMKVPPPRDNGQPHRRCDSVVDVLHNPSMYVVFHDNQAYPDYLITFK